MKAVESLSIKKNKKRRKEWNIEEEEVVLRLRYLDQFVGRMNLKDYFMKREKGAYQNVHIYAEENFVHPTNVPGAPQLQEWSFRARHKCPQPSSDCRQQGSVITIT